MCSPCMKKEYVNRYEVHINIDIYCRYRYVCVCVHVCTHTHTQNADMYVDKKNQLDVTFCTLYFSSNSCSTCFGQPCAHHQELTTA